MAMVASQRCGMHQARAPRLCQATSLQRCTRVSCNAAQIQEVVQEVQLSVLPGKVTHFNASQHEHLLTTAGSRLVVVDVYTTWCGPCKLIAPELELIAEEHGDKIIMSKIDCTTSPENKKWAMANNVKALPTFILFKDGKRVNDMTGAKAQNLRKLIEAHM